MTALQRGPGRPPARLPDGTLVSEDRARRVAYLVEEGVPRGEAVTLVAAEDGVSPGAIFAQLAKRAGRGPGPAGETGHGYAGKATAEPPVRVRVSRHALNSVLPLSQSAGDAGAALVTALARLDSLRRLAVEDWRNDRKQAARATMRALQEEQAELRRLLAAYDRACQAVANEMQT